MNPVTTSTGIRSNRPNTFVTVQAVTKRSGSNLSSELITAILGEADGGVPGRAYIVEGRAIESEAEAVLRSGPLLDFIKLNVAPGGDAAKRVGAYIFVNVKPGTLGVADFKGSAGAITLTAAAGSTSSLLNLAVVAGLTVPIRKGTILTFTGGKSVQLLADLPNNASAQSVAIKTLAGALVAAADTSAFVEPLFSLETKTKYRDRANQVAYTVSGSLLAGYRIVVKDNDLGSTIVDQDKLGLAFTLQYAGLTAGAKTVTVTNVGGIRRLTTNVVGNALENLDINLNGRKLREVVQNINSIGPYQAVLSRDGNVKADFVDVVSAQDISGAPYQMTALVADVAQFFKSGVNPDLFNYAQGGGTALAAQSGYFAGGTAGATTTTDWQAGAYALDKLLFASWAALTEDQAVIAALGQVGSSFWDPSTSTCPQFFFGCPSSELPVDESAANITAFLNSQASKVAAVNDYTRVKAIQARDIIDVDGLLRRAAPYETAASLAALRVAIGVSEPMTYKNLKGTNVFPKLDRPGNNTGTDRAVAIGVTALEPAGSDGSVRVVFGRTTYVGENNDIYETESMMAKLATMARGAKPIQEAAIPGKNILPGQLSSLSRDLNSYYRNYQDRGFLVDGVDANGVAVKGFVVNLERSTQLGKLIRSTASLSITPEGRVGEHNIFAQAVDVTIATGA